MAHRKNHSRKNKNRLNKSRRHRGGMAPVDDTSMLQGQKDSLAQGSQYLNIHKAQHGGAGAPYPTAVTDSPLTGSMVASARTGPLDTAISQIQGMQDGGKRRVNKNKNKKNKTKKNKKNKNKNKKNKTKQRRNHRGGSNTLTGSPLSENSMLLPSGLEKQASLNNDWSAARDPNYWAPKQ
jgi:hypothetical protein